MAAFETTRPAPFGAISTFHFVQRMSDLLATVVAWNDARATRAALSKLSDRELDDIGLCRGDIDDICALRPDIKDHDGDYKDHDIDYKDDDDKIFLESTCSF